MLQSTLKPAFASPPSSALKKEAVLLRIERAFSTAAMSGNFIVTSRWASAALSSVPEPAPMATSVRGMLKIDDNTVCTAFSKAADVAEKVSRILISPTGPFGGHSELPAALYEPYGQSSHTLLLECLPASQVLQVRSAVLHPSPPQQ
jgi:hypothetical protein